MKEIQEKEKSVFSRRNIRKWILAISFLLIPVTIFYVSPVIIMMGAKNGIVTGSMILFIVLFLVSLFVARLWCGWLCPMGAWQEICSPVMKRTVKDGRLNKVKYGVTAIWIFIIAYLFASAGGILTVDPFYGTVNGISISSFQVVPIIAIIFAVIFIVAYITGRRGFCHVLCPMAGLMIAGRKIRNFAGRPALQLSADASQCVNCRECSKECPMGLDVNGMVQKGNMENSDCIMCSSCADACPEGIIRYAWRKI